jgi:hypothetical protein
MQHTVPSYTCIRQQSILAVNIWSQFVSKVLFWERHSRECLISDIYINENNSLYKMTTWHKMTSKKYEYIEVQNGHLLPLIIHCLSKIKEHIEKIGKERDTYKHPRHTRLFFWRAAVQCFEDRKIHSLLLTRSSTHWKNIGRRNPPSNIVLQSFTIITEYWRC